MGFWAVEMFYYLFLAEGGDRWHDENFSWGAQFGNYMLYIVSFYMVKEVLKSVIENRKAGKTCARRDVIFVSASAVFFVYLTGCRRFVFSACNGRTFPVVLGELL